MHAAVVVVHAAEVAHVRGLRVLAQELVVVGGAGCFHGADGHAVHAPPEQAGAEEPVRSGRGLLQRVLLDQRAEDVGEVLVERAGLAGVRQARAVLRHAVRQLVRDDVERFGEAREQLAVAVAVEHLPPVPLRVVEMRAVVHGRLQRHAAAVDGVAFVDLAIKVVRLRRAVLRFLRRGVRASAQRRSRQVAAVARVVDRDALRVGGGRGYGVAHDRALTAELRGELERCVRALALRGAAGAGQRAQHVRRNEATAH